MSAREPRYFFEVNSANFPCHLGRALWWHDGSRDRNALDEINAGDVVYHYIGTKVNSEPLKKICKVSDCRGSMVIRRSKVKHVDRGPAGSSFDANDLRSKLSSVLGGVLGKDPCAEMDLDGYLGQKLYGKFFANPNRRYFMAELEDARPFLRGLHDLGLSAGNLQRYLVRLESDLAGQEGAGPARGPDEVLSDSVSESGLVLDKGMLGRVLVAASRGNVLLTGPPGLGKSTLAKPVDGVRRQESYGILLILLTNSLHDP